MPSSVRNEFSRIDLKLIADMIEPNARVLDVGCGNGDLLKLLADRHSIDARGIELSRDGVAEAVSKGFAVVQGDADTDLENYPDNAFDYVILSQTIQATRNPKLVLEHMLRIGHHAIVSFPNFGHWRIRLQLMFKGHMPITDTLSYSWWDTPNIHFCTIRDFVGLVDKIGAIQQSAQALDANGRLIRFNMPWWFWNLFGEQAVFVLKRGK